jgi:hypothetical protein
MHSNLNKNVKIIIIFLCLFTFIELRSRVFVINNIIDTEFILIFCF